jgi:hypothetical protein
MSGSAENIHNALEAVARFRDLRRGNAPLSAANAAIKRFQAQRFEATYPDLLQSQRYQTAARFFLLELYSDKDYAERDQQFARIANTIARLFPQSVINTAAALAEVHALTERLDDAMARAYLALQSASDSFGSQINAATYIACWRQVADPAARHHQLEVVLALGQSLDSLTRKPGLRMLLKMMRGPASAAGLASLQGFLEAGFDAFQTMRGADEFLKLIALREADWIQRLFEEEAVACETKLCVLLASNSLI